jgi:hypothetical protein
LRDGVERGAGQDRHREERREERRQRAQSIS